jgi:exonuclease III
MPYLKIGSINIQGGSSRKLSFHEVKELVNTFDIVCLQETWLTDRDSLQLTGYNIHRSDRKNNKRKHCGSGGVVTLYKSNLEKGVSKIKSQSNDLMWMKLDKHFFHLEKDMYICNCYISPQNSAVTESDIVTPLDILQQEIELYEAQGDIALIGDFNCRTGNIQENIYDITDLTDDRRLESRTEINIPPRHNEDVTVNKYGKLLLGLIEQAHMIILNGRTLGDLQGSKTCHKYNGSSTVDYMIVSKDLWNNVLTFRVLDQNWFTDHCPLSCHIKLSNPWITPEKPDKLSPTTRYIWGGDSEEKLSLLVKDTEFVEKCNAILTITDTNKCTEALTEIFTDLAARGLTKRISSPTNITTKSKRERIPVDPKLICAKREFRKAKRNYNNNKNDNNRRIEFISQRSKYKKIKYLTQRYQKEDKLYKLAMIENKQPNLFWKSIKSLMPMKTATPQINSTDWISYFSKLLNRQDPIGVEKEGKQFRDYIKHSLPIIEGNMTLVGPLDKPIDADEVTKYTKELKNNKAVGSDGLCNEFLKCTCKSVHVSRAVLHMFNAILTNGNYPREWMSNIITPIYKSGDVNVPQNYRGIAISNSMNKLFTKIINSRIYNYLCERNFWSPHQNGFMKGKRTDDNIFILHTIFQKYVKQKKGKIYASFVDLKKYFDSINRNCLMYKLIKCGITGKMYRVIKASYNNPLFCVKTKLGLTDYFTSITGVKQGCILSPLLSNIFQNDLHECFDETCHPVELNNMYLSSLSWADDLVLFSETKTGLQNSLDKLDTYCQKWGLSVNTAKSKCTVFSLGNAKMPNFTLGGNILENVNSYKYLGVIVHRNGKFAHAINDRCTKAKRAIHVLKQVLGYSNNSPAKLAMSLFDKQIQPILLYGSSIWSISDCNRHIMLLVNKIETRVKYQVQQIFLNRLNRVIDIEETRAFRGKNQILVKVRQIEDKLDLLYRSKNIDGNKIVDHTTKKDIAFEVPYNLFCKYALGVTKFASTTGVLSELNRFPVAIKAWTQSVSYWHRLETSKTCGILLENAYLECKNYKHAFYQNVQYLLLKNGLGNVLDSAHHFRSKQVASLLKQNLIDQFKQGVHSVISNEDKFSTLRLCKYDQKYSNTDLYYKTIKSPYMRKCLARLRLDKASTFTGKVDNKCDACNTDSSSVHLLTECQKSVVERISFINKLRLLYPQYVTKSSADQCKILLNLSHWNENVVKAMLSYIKSICVKHSIM